MALLFFDGFDDFPNTQTVVNEVSAKGWNGSTNLFLGVGFSGTSGRYSYGAAILINAPTAQVSKYLNCLVSDIIIGLAFNVASISTSGTIFTLFSSRYGTSTGTTDSIAYTFNFVTGTNVIQVKDSSGNVLGTSNSGILTTNSWNYFEFRLKIHPTAGIIQMMKDGISVCNLSSLNTAPVFTSVSLAQFSSPGSFNTFYDDLYIVDNSDSTGFLGECRTLVLNPINDNSIQFTPSGLIPTNYDKIDDAAGHDGDTTYVQSSTDGAKDLYQLNSLIYNPASIFGVRNAMVVRTAQAPSLIRQVLNNGTLNSISYPKILRTDYSFTTSNDSSFKFYNLINIINPITKSAWSFSDFNSLQFGFQNSIGIIDNYRSIVIQEYPLAYYRINETTGTVATDSSGNGNAGTYSNVTLNTASLLANSSASNSGTFNGTTSKLDSATLPAINTLTGTVTMNGWFKPTSLPSSGNFVELFGLIGTTGTTNLLGLRLDSSGNLVAYWYNSSGTISSAATTTTPIAINTIYSITLKVAASVYTVYVNGVSVLTGTYSSYTGFNTTVRFRVGAGASASSGYPINYEFTGLISEASIYYRSLGTGVLTTLYSCGIGSFLNSSDTASGINVNNSIAQIAASSLLDPLFSSVIFLSHLDVVPIVDIKSSTITTFGTVAASTTQSKYGGTSLQCTSGGFSVANSLFNLTSSQSFTIEGWFYITSLSTPINIFSLGDNNTGRASVVVNSSGTISFIFNGTTINSSLSTVSTNTWHHIVWTRGGSTQSIILVDGVQFLLDGLGASILGVNGFFKVGLNNSNTPNMVGFIDDIRFTLTNRYSVPYTVPTVVFPDTGTLTGLSRTNIGRNIGKYYFEAIIQSLIQLGNGTYPYIGINSSSEPNTDYVGQTSTGYSYRTDGTYWNNNTQATNVIGAISSTVNDIIMVAVDLDLGYIWFGKNGNWLGGFPGIGTPSMTFTPGSTFYPAISPISAGAQIQYKGDTGQLSYYGDSFMIGNSAQGAISSSKFPTGFIPWGGY